MQITMTTTRRVSEDGFTVRELRAGETYDLADGAARRLIRSGQAHVPGEEPLVPLSKISLFGFHFPDDSLAGFDASRDEALAAAEGNSGLTAFLHELSASAVRVSKERIVQNPATLLATGEL